MKRKIFIGSSSEGLEIAAKVKNQVEQKLGDWIECEIWNKGEVFSLNKGTLESLIKASHKYDYGILIASKDDKLFTRRKKYKVMRDNVLFESGLFFGSLGLQRAFLLADKQIKLPSDFNGTTIAMYNSKNISDAIDKIIKAIQDTKECFILKPLPSTAIAHGYFTNFVLPFSHKLLQKHPKGFMFKIIIPKNIKDIDTTIKQYTIANPSTMLQEERPIAYKYDHSENQYWDIPTTLTTIDRLIELFINSHEIGDNPEKKAWLEHEVRNFKEALEILIHQHGNFENNIFIEYA